MKIQFNSNFDKILNAPIGTFFEKELSIELLPIIESKILSTKEGFYFKINLPEDEDISCFYEDKTGNEASNNNILLNDYYTDDTDS